MTGKANLPSRPIGAPVSPGAFATGVSPAVKYQVPESSLISSLCRASSSTAASVACASNGPQIMLVLSEAL